MSDDSPGFFRNLGALASDWVGAKRRALASEEPQTAVDSAGGGVGHSFNGQEITFSDLRDIKDMREGGGQIAQLMNYKALLNFGEGAEFSVEDNEETAELIDGTELTLQRWLELQFPNIDLLVLDMGEDALWYPYAVGEILENRAGGFKEFLPAEPHTLLPETDLKGNIIAWHQRVQAKGGYKESRLSPEDLTHIVVNKSSARDKTGISEVLRNQDEIAAFKQNEKAINQAIELHGFPQRHIKVGRENGAPVRDDELRRYRSLFDPRTTDANTAYFTGQDVDIESIEAENFDYSAVHEMDMRNLTTALGLPLEAGNVGADGLGSGKPAELRFALLKLAIKANQRSFSTQFVEKIVRPVVRDFSPFDHTAQINLNINDPLEDIGEVADLINSVGDYMTNAEARRRLDLPEPEDDDVSESYRSPADIERDEEGVSDEPMGGLFNRELQDIEDIDTGDYPEAAKENAQMALDARDETGNPNDCGTQVGWTRANQLANGEDLSEDTIGRMANFARHEDNKDQGEEGRSDCGWLMWNAWGGTEGIEWAQRKVDEFEEARQASGETDFRSLSEGITDDQIAQSPEWDQPLLEAHKKITDYGGDPNRELVGFVESTTPEFVKERIRENILEGAIFSDFANVSDSDLMQLRENLLETLTSDSWTIDGVADQLEQLPGVDTQNARTIARTETASVLNSAREDGYEEQGEADDSLFYWSGATPGDTRQTDACEWLIEKTNPNYGGNPVSLSKLRDLVEEAPTHDDEMQDNLARPDSWVIHPNERSTFVKAPGT